MSAIEIENIIDIPNGYDYSINSIRKLDSIQYNTFFNSFMVQNIPCVIKNAAAKWECASKWNNDELINYSYLIEKYGDLEAPVANCDNIKYNAQCKNTMKVKNYLEYLMSNRNEGLLYLKDWHLKRIQPQDRFYEVPWIFYSDWLNEFAVDHQDDDFMFVYIGPKDSWTPLHADVYCSYSWSANIVGRKRWILFPPGEEEKLKDSLGNLPLLFTPDKYANVKYFEVVQEKGEAIFVPSGWHHQVVNVLDTISVNHNWINGCNIHFVWTALQKTLLSVEREIEEYKDSPDFLSQCQLILKSLFGMNFETFVDFISYIGKKRVRQLKEHKLSFNNFLLGKKHIMFDLINISKIISSICSHPLYLSEQLSLNEDFLKIKNSITHMLE